MREFVRGMVWALEFTGVIDHHQALDTVRDFEARHRNK
jgi:hypothetical protein